MKNAHTTDTEIQNAIDESMGRDAIVTLAWTQEREDVLLTVSDDYAESSDCVEFWAASDEQGDDAMTWRVHLAR